MLNGLPLFKDMKIRFLFVGILNTIVGYGVYALCIYEGLSYSPALIITYLVGIAHSYFWNKFFTFRSREKSLGEIVRFFLVYIAAYLVNLVTLYVCVDGMKMNVYFVGIAAMFITTLISYLGHKTISFRKKA
jgi:putative flippase GtrA